MKKFKLAERIRIIVPIVAIAAMAVTAVISFTRIRGIASAAEKSSERLGEIAAAESVDALVAQAREQLNVLSQEQAAAINLALHSAAARAKDPNRGAGPSSANEAALALIQRAVNTRISGGYVFLLDKDCRYLTASAFAAKGSSAYDGASETWKTALDAMRTDDANDGGVYRAEVYGMDSYVFTARIAETGWFLCGVMPMSVLLARADKTKAAIRQISIDEHRRVQSLFQTEVWAAVIIFVFASLIIIIISMVLSGRLASPVNVLSADNERVHDELALARDIQNKILPDSGNFTKDGRFEIYAKAAPAKEIGGDFYDFFYVGRDKLACVIGDVCGKGVSASFFMVISKMMLKKNVMQGFGPAKALDELNAVLCQDNPGNIFCTVFLFILDLKSGKALCANGGHTLPLISYDGGPLVYLETLRIPPPGIFEDTSYVEETFMLLPGGKIYLYTDGVTEAQNKSLELFGRERLLKTADLNAGKSPREFDETVRAAVAAWEDGSEQADDVTTLAIAYKGANNV
jgi:sigma-B regulation protein RsbU (phosphoserine phosphatase)